uniref:Zinc finger protein 26 n=2 Tax=Lygus hesperus TaxID=30085 RepID=A0A0A9Y101_LYGHE
MSRSLVPLREAEPNEDSPEEMLYSETNTELITIKIESNEDFTEVVFGCDQLESRIEEEPPIIDIKLEDLVSSDSFVSENTCNGSVTTKNRSITSEEEVEATPELTHECIIPPPTPTSASKARIKPYRTHVQQKTRIIPFESLVSQSAATKSPVTRVEMLPVIGKGRETTRKERSYYGPKGSFSCIFYCYSCDYATKYKKRLETHVIKHLPREHCCELCSYKSFTKRYLKMHMKIHTGERKFSCSKCEFKTMWKHHLVEHELTHGQEKPYACHLCLFKSKTIGNLKAHLKIHDGLRKWKCDYCPYSAVQSHTLKEHMLIHTGEKNHVCTQCDFRTNRRSTLRDHVRYRHEKVKELQCPFCEYKSAHKGNMKSHIRKHTNERPYLCDKCPFRAHTSDVLKRHIMIHTGERNYECDVCSYRSVKEGTMIEHVNSVHFKLAPFMCHHCGYRSARLRVLKTHIMNHFGIRKKACDYPGCTYRSNSQSAMNDHKLVHTSEKPHVCPTCFHRCRTAKLLKRHLVSHEPPKFWCSECDFGTKRQQSLKIHMRIHNESLH